ncbi:hypothetical protein Dimus_037195 [Dionaea muscipula]
MALTNKSSCFGAMMILGVVLALGLLVSNVSSSRLLTSSEQSVREMHEQWMSQYGRVYKDDAEKEERFKIFKQNLEFIESSNKLNKGYTLGLNAFSDLTNEEFRASHNGYKRPLKKQASSNLRPSPFNFTDVPATVDWTAAGAVTPVKDQGQCGCCWAFSAVAAIEGMSYIKNGALPDCSEQQIVDCDTGGNDAGCNGGTPDGAFEYVRSYGGIESEDAYPYTGSQGSCNAAANPIIASITGFQDVPANNEEALQQAVASQPVSVAIDASDPSFQSYSSGIYSGPCSTNLDHAVTVVGYGTDPNSGNPYWIVKNSWGTSWGQQGYIWMQMGLNPPYGVCGIAMQASYPTA